MKKLLTKGQIAILVIFSVLIIDQVIKIWIKTHMYWHESIRITDWFYIYFTENNGMAFGMELFGKLFLTTFRIVAVGLIGWYLYKIVKRGLKTGYIICVSLILTGALGNIIDSVFYGVIFNESTHSQIASFMPDGGGYSTWFYGKVVDMFYFPIIDTKKFFRFHLCCICLLVLIVSACKVKRPDSVISESEMENLLYDYHIAKAMGENMPGGENYKKALYVEAVFKKYGTTEEVFDSSMVWYTRNTKIL